MPRVQTMLQVLRTHHFISSCPPPPPTHTLSMLHNLPDLQVLKLAENGHLNTFHFHFGELTKLYMEAKDNVKFLSTLERHFKHLTDGSFTVVSDGMFSMINGLKMVWVISRHYNTGGTASSLLVR